MFLHLAWKICTEIFSILCKDYNKDMSSYLRISTDLSHSFCSGVRTEIFPSFEAGRGACKIFGFAREPQGLWKSLISRNGTFILHLANANKRPYHHLISKHHPQDNGKSYHPSSRVDEKLKLRRSLRPSFSPAWLSLFLGTRDVWMIHMIICEWFVARERFKFTSLVFELSNQLGTFGFGIRNGVTIGVPSAQLTVQHQFYGAMFDAQKILRLHLLLSTSVISDGPILWCPAPIPLTLKTLRLHWRARCDQVLQFDCSYQPASFLGLSLNAPGQSFDVQSRSLDAQNRGPILWCPEPLPWRSKPWPGLAI